MSSRFSSEETERYSRHLVLPEIGGPGQQKLKAARVLIVGAGGLGAPSIQYLAAAGVGHITIVDDDVVSLSNLQRQIIHTTPTLGMSKVKSAEQAARTINPHTNIDAINARITPENAGKIVQSHTLALDGSDNFATRYLMADTCAEAHIPLVTAAVNRFDGSITTLKPWLSDNPSYRDLFPEKPDDGLLPTCAEAGVLGALVGILGTMQALEAIKEITGAGETLVGRLLMVDGLSMRFETIDYKRISQ